LTTRPSATVSSVVVSPEGDTPTTKPPLLFVHGNIHGGWVFTALAKKLAERGYESHLITMPKYKFKTLYDYVDDVQAYIEKLDKAPVLLGHSQGGLEIQYYLLNRQQEMPAHTHAKAAVFLGAVSGHSIMDMLKFTVHAAMDNPQAFGRMLAEFNSANVIGHTFDLMHAKKTMFAPGTTHTNLAGEGDETLEAYLARLSPVESGSVLVDVFSHLLFKGGNKATPEQLNVPTLTVTAEHDGIVPAFVTESITKYWQSDSVVITGQGHCFGDPGWEEAVPGPLADWLDKAMGSRR
jgi:non-heme chloroperoxidase